MTSDQCDTLAMAEFSMTDDPPPSTLRLVSLSPSLYPPSSALACLFAIRSNQHYSVGNSLLATPSSTPRQEHRQYPPPPILLPLPYPALPPRSSPRRQSRDSPRCYPILPTLPTIAPPVLRLPITAPSVRSDPAHHMPTR